MTQYAHPNSSPFPWHHFPQWGPKGYYLIDSDTRLMDGDLCWHMDTDTWHPIARKDIGKKDSGYMRVARPVENTMLNRAKKGTIKWQPMETANKNCETLLLRLKNGRTVIGCTQSIAPRYERQGWFLNRADPTGPYGEDDTTDKRIYPVAWAPLPE